MLTGRIVQISVSPGGVPKRPIPEAMVTQAGLVGDAQTNLKVHGGPDRALCLWSEAVIHQLQTEGHEIAPGDAGENITIAGVPWPELSPGTILHLGSTAQVQITDYTAPCRQIMHCFCDRKYSRISQKHHPGSSRLYARVLSEGTIKPGDAVTVLDSPA